MCNPREILKLIPFFINTAYSRAMQKWANSNVSNSRIIVNRLAFKKCNGQHNGRVLPKCNSEKLHKFCLIELSKHGYWLFKSYSFPVKETVNFNRGVGTLNAIMHWSYNLKMVIHFIFREKTATRNQYILLK